MLQRKDNETELLLTISLLVSNNIATIRNCMESLKPVLEQIPSELIVVDTVGPKCSDGSLDIAKEYATRIVHFEWCNDFAAARNAGLSIAKGRWFMYLDDDEWFEDTEEIIRFFKEEEYLNYASATYQIRNYTDKQGRNYNTAVLGRMIRRSEGLTFIGKIHEVFSKIELPCKNFSTYVHHFGYVYETEEEKQKHRKRNIELLKAELEINPTNLHYRTQMALELATFDNKAALDFCEETFQLCKRDHKKSNFQWQVALVFRLYEALGKNSEQADAKYMELKADFGYNEMAENAISYQMARIHMINNKPEKAYPYAVMYFKTLQFLKENPELRQIQMAADFQRYQEMDSYLEMLHFGAYSAYHVQAYQEAWQWYMKMPWEQKEFQNAEAFFLMVQLYQNNRNISNVVGIIKRVMKNETLIGNQKVRNTISAILASIK